MIKEIRKIIAEFLLKKSMNVMPSCNEKIILCQLIQNYCSVVRKNFIQQRLSAESKDSTLPNGNVR